MRARTKWNNVTVGCLIASVMSMLAGCVESSDSSSSSESPKPVVLISTEPTSLVRGGYVIIRWSTTGATDCHASGEWRGVRPISGSETFLTTDSGTNEFTLSCTGAGGSTTTTTKLKVFRGV